MALRRKALTAATFVPFDDAIGTQITATSWADSVLWQYWRIVGELHFATTFLARQVARVRWNVEVNGQRLSDDKADEYIADLTMPRGSRNVAEALALNFQVPGRMWYLHQPTTGWEVVATTHPDVKKRVETADVVVFGINQDPENPKNADSPVKANMLTIQELALLQQQQRAQARNRLAQRGMLFYPNDVDFEGDFETDFKKSVTAPIEDEGSSASVVPHIIGFPSDFIEKWRAMIPDYPYDEQLPAKIEAVTRRLALGLDMPPEALLGIGNANHWSMWAIQESTYRAHTEPLAEKVGFVLAKAAIKFFDEAVVRITPDPTPLLARVGSVTDALEMFDRGIVNAEFVRDRAGAQDDDAPDEATRQEQLGIGSREPAIRRLSQDRQGPPAERPRR